MTRNALNWRRHLDPAVADPQRVTAAVAGGVGVLAGLAVLTPNRLVRALLVGGASAVGVGLPFNVAVKSSRTELNELRSLWGLSGVLSEGRAWPAPGGWALGADALLFLIGEIRRRDARVVVELGPGTSSVVLGRAIDNLELHGLEHDDRYVRVVRDMLDHHGLEGYSLHHAPLQPIAGDGAAEWYSADALDALPARIDVLIVDGPPNWSGGQNRAPAWARLRQRMARGALVLVDDTQRPAERAMANAWIDGGGIDLLFDGGTFMVLEVA